MQALSSISGAQEKREKLTVLLYQCQRESLFYGAVVDLSYKLVAVSFVRWDEDVALKDD